MAITADFPPQIKICCIGSLEEAQLAMSLGASALGLVSAMPSGPGVISESKIAEIAEEVSAQIETFLLTSATNSREIIEQHRRCRTTTLQLVDHVSQADLEVLREQLQGVRLVQVIHVQDTRSVDAALAVAERVDAILLDSGRPSLAVKELGGTGRTHNWQISARIVSQVEVPVYLAGGINPSNVCEAIAAVEPYGLDLCSSVRSNGRLDARLLKNFMDAAGGRFTRTESSRC